MKPDGVGGNRELFGSLLGAPAHYQLRQNLDLSRCEMYEVLPGLLSFGALPPAGM